MVSRGRWVADRPMRWGAGDALRAELLEALEAQRQVRPALRPGDGVDLVHDDVLDAAEDVAGLAGQDQVEALRGRDQDVGRVPDEPAPVLLGRVAGPGGDGDLRSAARQVARPPDAMPASGARRFRSMS